MNPPDIREVEPGLYSIIRNGKSFAVRITNQNVADIAGHSFTVEVRDPRDARREVNSNRGGGRQNITASMPGKVVRVLISMGQAIEPGQGLIVIEAMKMQNEVKASRAGRVVKINVQDGGTVAAGDILLILE